MKKLMFILFLAALNICFVNNLKAQDNPSAPKFTEWSDDFSGDKLDEKKWEKFTFEGGSGGKFEIKDGEIRMRSTAKTRAGVRSVETFTGDKFIAEAHLARVGDAYPDPGSNSSTLGFGTLTLLFDNSGRNRIEWILTSEGTFEAWVTRDGQGERLDNKKLGTKMKNPVLAIARVGDTFKFIINSADGKPEDAQIGLQTTIKNMPKSFRLMLYGYGSSENDWNSARVVVVK